MSVHHHHQEHGTWNVSILDTELSVCMQGLCCEESSSTPRRLTPEMSSPDRGPPSGQHSPTAIRATTRHRRVTSPEQTPNRDRSRLCSLRGRSEGDKDAEDDKENSRGRKRVRVRLFSSSSPEDQLQSGGRSKRQSRSSPAEGEPETPDPEPLMLFQRLRSRTNPSDALIPVSAITDHGLIGDFSKHHVLPVEKVDHQDLHCVSAQTVASLIGGQYRASVEDFLIIDCRYPYEYQGGHIKGAVNLYTELQIQQAFLQGSSTTQVSPAAHSTPGETSALDVWGSGGAKPASEGHVTGVTEGPSTPRKLIVFHCEFSSKRGPRLCHYLRHLDRAANAQTYPHLLYPELYLLQGGYKHFYSCCPELCEPCGYVPMRHRKFREQFRCFNKKRHQHRLRRPIRTQQRTSHV